MESGVSRMKKYLRFEEFHPIKSRKTKLYDIHNDVKKEHIGIITWDTAWRQYISILNNSICVTAGCHREIADFIEGLMAERKSSPNLKIKESQNIAAKEL